MFPIISLLRRSATSIVYIDTSDISFPEKAQCVMYRDGAFIFEERETAEIMQLSSEASPQEASISLCKRENDIFSFVKTTNSPYTIFVGPEEYSDGKRYTRIGVALGIHRSK